MAVEAPGVSMLTVKADADMIDESNIYLVVALGPAENMMGDGQGGAGVTPYKAGGNKPFGIAQNNAPLGMGVGVMLDGLSRCRAAGTWTVGDELSVADGGKLQKAGSSDDIFGKAFESAVEGDISSVVFSCK